MNYHIVGGSLQALVMELFSGEGMRRGRWSSCVVVKMPNISGRLIALGGSRKSNKKERKSEEAE